MSAKNQTEIGWKTTLPLAAAAGAGVANIYFNQPMLAEIQRELPGSMTGIVPTVTQIGYTLGLLFLVPLGDVYDRRKLIGGQFAALGFALIAAALAPSGLLLAVASIAIGITSSVAQQIVPFAAQLASEKRRGAVVGTVMAGLLTGILLSRTLAGFVSLHFGWRSMFCLGVPLAWIAGAGLVRVLPVASSVVGVTYRNLLNSTVQLWGKHRSLRMAVFTQGLLFGSFSMFWTVLAYHLEEPKFGLGSDAAGLFGMVGAAGVLVAPVAGRISDRWGPRPVIFAGVALCLAAWGVMGLWDSLAGLIAGVLLLDFGIQGALISHQTIVFALEPEARGRMNTVFMSGMFLGGAAGSASAIQAWSYGGWSAVVISGAVASALAGGVQLLFMKRK